VDGVSVVKDKGSTSQSFGVTVDLKLGFGRLYFLLDDQQYWFCEVNPNGQFAWLDLKGKNGLLQAVVSEISPLTAHHPIPVRHPLDSRSEGRSCVCVRTSSEDLPA
jgi:hypothetical protein